MHYHCLYMMYILVRHVQIIGKKCGRTDKHKTDRRNMLWQQKIKTIILTKSGEMTRNFAKKIFFNYMHTQHKQQRKELGESLPQYWNTWRRDGN